MLKRASRVSPRFVSIFVCSEAQIKKKKPKTETHTHALKSAEPINNRNNSNKNISKRNKKNPWNNAKTSSNYFVFSHKFNIVPQSLLEYKRILLFPLFFFDIWSPKRKREKRAQNWINKRTVARAFVFVRLCVRWPFNKNGSYVISFICLYAFGLYWL